MKILIADDHGLFRAGLEGVLAGFVGSQAPLHAATVDEAMRRLERDDFDLVLLDLFMPGMDGVDGLERLRRCAPTAPIVVISASDSPRHADAALSAGAVGYIAKSASPSRLLEALRAVVEQGEICVVGVDETRAADPLARLTPRQQDIARCVALGLSNRDIAARCAISEGTVKLHVSSILKALGLKNRGALARLVNVFDAPIDPRGEVE